MQAFPLGRFAQLERTLPSVVMFISTATKNTECSLRTAASLGVSTISRATRSFYTGNRIERVIALCSLFAEDRRSVLQAGKLSRLQGESRTAKFSGRMDL